MEKINKNGFVWKVRDSNWQKRNPGKSKLYKYYPYGLPADYVPSGTTAIEIGNKLVPKRGSVSVKRLTGNYVRVNNARIKKPDVSTPGCYAIICEKENSVYVGQSVNMESRLRNHRMAISGPLGSQGRVYVKMRKHWRLHGPDSFEFKKYIISKDSSVDNLTRLEIEAMHSFLSKGYKLYNLNVPLGNDGILCPSDLRALFTKLIEMAKKDASIKQALESMIK